MADIPPELTIKSPKFLKMAKAFFADKITEADYEEYPIVDETDGVKSVCTISFSDKKRKYNNKTIAVTLTHEIMLKLKERYFEITGSKSPAKPYLCFVMYVMQNLFVKGTNKTVYDEMVKTDFVVGKTLDNPWKKIFFDLCMAVNSFEYSKFKVFLETWVSDLPESSVTAIKKQLKEMIHKGDFSFPIKDFFRIYDDETKRFVNSIFEDADIITPVNIFLQKINKVYDISMLNKLSLYITIHNVNRTFAEAVQKYNETLCHVATVMNKIEKKEFGDFTIKDFFENPVFTDWNETTQSVYDTIFTNANQHKPLIDKLYIFLVDKKLIQPIANANANANALTKKNAVQTTLQSLNARIHCTHGRHEFSGDAFEDLAFTSIDSFVSYEGYCFSLIELASLIISKKGLVVVDNVTFSKVFIKELINKIALYISTHADHPIVKYDIQGLKNSFIVNFEKEFTTNSLQQKTLTLTVPGTDVTINLENPFYKSLQSQQSFEAWQDFYNKLINDYAAQIKLLGVRKVYEKSCNTIFEITGLLGYMCLADDISIFDNDGTYFFTSEYCKEQYKFLMNEEIRNLDIAKDIASISFNNKTFKDLITELDSASCIHGIGNSFLRYYIYAYEAGKEALPYVLNDIGGIFNNKVKRVIIDYNEFVMTVNSEHAKANANANAKAEILAQINLDISPSLNNEEINNITQSIRDNINKIQKSKLDPLLKIEFQQNLQWYLNEFQDLFDHEAKRRTSTKKLKPVLDDNKEAVAKMFKMAPYIIEAPEQIKKATGIAYLTCVYMDKSLAKMLTTNPNNYSMLVFGYTENPNSSIKCMYLRSDKYANYVHYSDIENFFKITDDYVYDKNKDNMRVEGYETYHHGHIFKKYYSDFNNVEDLYKLIQIPMRFHKQRIQTFKIFKDYCLNLCKMMDVNANANPSNNTKHNKLANIATKPVYDFMTLEESKLIPRYMTVINANSKHMWNASFKQASQDVFVDSLQNFITLPYVIEKDKGGNIKAIIKSPFGNNKDLTAPYQISTLLAKLLIEEDDPYKGKDWTESILTQYYYFESYFKMVNEQDSTLRSYLFKNIEDELVDYPNALNEANEIIAKGKIDTITIVKYFDEIKNIDLKVAIMKRLQVFMGLFYMAFHVYNCEYTYYKYAKKHYTSPEMDLINFVFSTITPSTMRSIKPKFFNLYTNLLDDYVKTICYEGMAQQNMQYHFTELRKEYYLLASLKSKFPTQLPLEMTMNEYNILTDKYHSKHKETLTKVLAEQEAMIQMIDTLNETFSYYKYDDKYDDDLKLMQLFEDEEKKTPNPNLHAESIPRAIEYLIKVRLVDAHKTRIYGALHPFERIIELAFSGSIKKKLESFKDDLGKKQAFITLLNDGLDIYNVEYSIDTMASAFLDKMRASQSIQKRHEVLDLYDKLFNFVTFAT